jgi:hypothetical protein
MIQEKYYTDLERGKKKKKPKWKLTARNSWQRNYKSLFFFFLLSFYILRKACHTF